jgi:hypothetical protein
VYPDDRDRIHLSVSTHVPDFRMPHPERQKFTKYFIELVNFSLNGFLTFAI